MADINISIGLSLIDTSLRDIASKVRSAFSNITPVINADIDETSFRKAIEKAATSPLLLRIAGIKEGDANILKKAVENALKGAKLGDLSKASLTRLQNQIQRAIETAAGKGLQAAGKGIQTAGALPSPTKLTPLGEGVSGTGQGATGANEEEAVRQRVLKELARREVATRNAAAITNAGLRQEGILNATLRQLIIAEQKRVIAKRNALAKESSQQEQKKFNAAVRELTNSVKREKKARQEIARKVTQGRASEIQQELRELEGAIKQEKKARQEIARKVTQSRASEIQQALRELENTIKKEKNERLKIAKSVTDSRAKEIQQALRELENSIKQEKNERRKIAKSVADNRAKEIQQALRELENAIKQEKNERLKIAKSVTQNRAKEIQQALRELENAIKEEKNARLKIAKSVTQNRAKEIQQALRELESTIKKEKNERLKIAKSVTDNRAKEIQEALRELENAIKQEKNERKKRNALLSSIGLKRFQEEERKLIALVKEDRRLQEKRLASFKAAAARGITAAGDDSDAAIQKRVIQELARLEVVTRGRRRATEEGLRNDGILNATLRRTIIAEQKNLFDADAPDIKQRNQEWREQTAILRQQRLATAQTTGFVRRGASLQRDLNTELVRRVTEARRSGQLARQSLERRAPGGGAGNIGSTVTFRGARDIESFGRRLNPQQLDRFTKALFGAARAGDNVTKVFDRFSRTSQKAVGFTAALEARITSGTRAAFNFGKQVQFAAERLLAWATPAAFLFRAIGLLQDSVRTIVELDTQATRLQFFRKGGLINQATGEARNLGEVLRNVSNDIDTFNTVSRRTGVAVGSVAEAIITLQRVGETVVDTTKDISGAQQALESNLLRTILALSRLEAGQLSTEQATRGLVAVFNQFQGVLQGIEGELRQTAIANIGAQIAGVARETTFNIAELTGATTRLGASFSQFAGANPAATLKLVSEAAKATGATESRLGTLFRQLATLVQQNEVALSTFGIQIRDTDEKSKTFGQVTMPLLIQSLVDFNRISVESPANAEKLAKLFADRRTLSDFKATAKALGREGIAKSLIELSKGAGEATRVADQVRETFLADSAAAESLAGRIQSLSSEFNEFVKGAGAADIFKTLISGASTLIGVFDGVLKVISKIGPALAGFAIAKIGPQIAAALGGALSGVINNVTKIGVRKEINVLLAETRTRIQGINLAEKEGLLTTQAASGFRSRNLQLTQAQALAQAELDALLLAENVERKAGTITQVRSLELEQLKTAAQVEINILKEREIALQLESNAAAAAGGGFVRRNSLALFAGAGLFAATLFGDNLGKAIGGQDKKLAAGVSSAFQNAGIGGIIGAQLGSIIPGIGTIVGGIGGVIIGGLAGFFGATSSEEKALAKDRKRRDEAQKARTKAFDAQTKVIDARQARINKLFIARGAAQEALKNTQQKIERLAAKIEKFERGSKDQLAAANELVKLQVELEAKREATALESLQIEARKILLAKNLLDIRIQQQREAARLNLLQDLAIEGQQKERTIQIKIEFSRAQVQNEIDAVLQQIRQQEAELRNVDIAQDRNARAGLERTITQLRARELNLRIKLERDTIKLRREAVTIASREAQKQIQAWVKAAKTVAGAFKKVVGLQSGLAKLITKQGDIAAKGIEQRARQTLTILEAQGLSAERRLLLIQESTNRQIAEVRRAGDFASRALQGGRIQAFSSAGEINEAVEGLIDSIRASAARAGDKEFTESRSIFDQELTLLREREKRERALFEVRIQQTRNEIGARRDLLSREIRLLQQRSEAEARFTRQRAEGQRKFGEILLQGPEKFRQAVNDIRASQRFFRGLRNLNEQSIQRIFSRARGAIVRGQIDQLNQVVRGVRTQIETGGRPIVAQVDNKRLLDALLRVLDPRITARELSEQLGEEGRLAQQRTAAQEAIKKRQTDLFNLATTDRELQEAQLRIAREARDRAIDQRNRLIALARIQLAAQLKTKDDLKAALARAAQFGATIPTTATPIGAAAGRAAARTPSGITGATGARAGTSASPLIVGGGTLGNIEGILRELLTCCKQCCRASGEVAKNTAAVPAGIAKVKVTGPVPAIPAGPRAVRTGGIGGEPDRGILGVTRNLQRLAPVPEEVRIKLDELVNTITSSDREIRQRRERITTDRGEAASVRRLRRGNVGNRLIEDRTTEALTGINQRIRGAQASISRSQLRSEEASNVLIGLRREVERRLKFAIAARKLTEQNLNSSEKLVINREAELGFAKEELEARKEEGKRIVRRERLQRSEFKINSENLKTAQARQKALQKEVAARTEFDADEAIRLSAKRVGGNLRLIDTIAADAAFRAARQIEEEKLQKDIKQNQTAINKLTKERARQQATLNNTITELTVQNQRIVRQDLEVFRRASRIDDAIASVKKRQLELERRRIEITKAELVARLARRPAPAPAAPARRDTAVGIAGPGRTGGFRKDFIDVVRDAARFSGGSFTIRSREQQRLRQQISEFTKRTGRGATPSQQRRLNFLQQRDLRRGRFGAGETSRRLLQDPRLLQQFGRATLGRLTQGPIRRDLLNIGGFNEGSFALRNAQRRGRFRVTGRRAREVDPAATRELLGDIGLSGLAAGVTNREEAVKALNLVFKLTEALQKDTREARREQARLLNQVLKADLENARKQTARDQQRRGGQVGKGELFKEDEGDRRNREKVRKEREEAQKAQTQQFANSIRQAGDEAADKFSTAIINVIDQASQTLSRVKIAGVKADVKFGVDVEINNAVGVDDFIGKITRALTAQNVPQSVIKVIIKQLCENSKALAQRGIIPPSLVEELCKENNGG